jgi:DNA-binding CsgD family transcriptional regulator
MAHSADAEQKIVDTIYRGACDPAELRRAVELIARYFESGGVLFGEFDHASPDAQFTVGVGTIDDAFLRDYAPYAPLDPAPQKFAAMPTGRATTSDRMFSAEFLRGNAFLNEFLRPHGVEGTLAAPLLSTEGRFAIIGVHQGTGRERFGDDDIARLERLAPHLTRALQIRRLFLQRELRAEVLESVVNRHPAGIIGRSCDGAPLFVNDAARAVAAAADGIGLDRRGGIVTSDRVAAKRLAALEDDVARGGSGGLVRVARPSGRQPYLVLVSPLPSTEDILLRTRRGILIVIHDPSRRPVAAARRLAQVLHVPLGAAKVLEAILLGIELKDYADREGISANTVKFHLKTAFDRTGARNQADLVREALLALSDLGPYFPDRG